jgi:predicted  nucleic acid-binding Zn-ribbon protein
MGWFKKRDPDEIERLHAEIASMSARLAASEQAKGELDTTVRGIVDRLASPRPPPSEPAPVAPVGPTVDPAEIDKLNARIQRLGDRVDGAAGVQPADVERIDEAVRHLTDRIAELDGRITSISTELANQLTELSGELESMGGREPVADEQDLADLADRLRRA